MRRLGGASVVIIVLGLFVSACLEDLTGPQKLCPELLYCGSAVVPQTVSGGTCCTVVDAVSGTLLPNATQGYLCAFGSGRQPFGCYANLQQARFACPSAPSIVQCEKE